MDQTVFLVLGIVKEIRARHVRFNGLSGLKYLLDRPLGMGVYILRGFRLKYRSPERRRIPTAVSSHQSDSSMEKAGDKIEDH